MSTVQTLHTHPNSLLLDPFFCNSAKPKRDTSISKWYLICLFQMCATGKPSAPHTTTRLVSKSKAYLGASECRARRPLGSAEQRSQSDQMGV